MYNNYIAYILIYVYEYSNLVYIYIYNLKKIKI